MNNSNSITTAKPFVKWAGGKTQLLEEIRASLPANMEHADDCIYVEPFVGGGAVLFWILQTYPNITKAVINDVNRELIDTYRTIRNNVEELIGLLSTIQAEYSVLNDRQRKEYYLEKRRIFNDRRRSETEMSALFIFLNRTCFNGLYRVNSKGEFNVPHGKYANPKICDADNLRRVSELLQKVEIMCGDFSLTRQFAGPNALFYCDPPYRPISATSSFTSYAEEKFDDNEQIRLGMFCREIAQKGATVIASNSDPKNANPSESFFEDIYSGFSIKRVYATRMINSVTEKRGKLTELLITSTPKSTMRNFEEWFGTLRKSIADYEYYTDFKKVFSNVDGLKIELNILNSLIGSRNIESDFETILTKYPETLKCIPILLAKRESEIDATDIDGEFKYDFRKMNYSMEQYKVFMRKTGLFDLIANHLVNNIVDYVTGVEAGLDSHGRKNRGGHLMENLIESYLVKSGFIKGKSYFKEMYHHKIEKKWGIDLSAISNSGTTKKRFDFVVKSANTVYGIEANFYKTHGSKLNETARSYKTIALESEGITDFRFIWFTDGHGWLDAKNNLRETFDVLPDLYCLNDLENGIMQSIFK